MKVNCFEGCAKSYKGVDGWVADAEKEHHRLLTIFQFSIVVEGDHLEHSAATQWSYDNVGLKEEQWEDLRYGKIGYDYGFWEFFFKEEKNAVIFRDAVPTFYAKTTVGNWKTDGYGTHINVQNAT